MKTVIKALLINLLVVSTTLAADFKSLPSIVARDAGISEADAQKQVEMVFNAIKSELKEGREISIKNFGRFFVKDRDEHEGRNPKTGEKISIPARKYPRFASSDNLKKELNN
jgi:DNA-binding protein HU-beta